MEFELDTQDKIVNDKIYKQQVKSFKGLTNQTVLSQCNEQFSFCYYLSMISNDLHSLLKNALKNASPDSLAYELNKLIHITKTDLDTLFIRQEVNSEIYNQIKQDGINDFRQELCENINFLTKKEQQYLIQKQELYKKQVSNFENLPAREIIILCNEQTTFYNYVWKMHSDLKKLAISQKVEPENFIKGLNSIINYNEKALVNQRLICNANSKILRQQKDQSTLNLFSKDDIKPCTK